MVNIIYPMAGLSLVCVVLALFMLLAKDALTCAMALLGILLCTAGIYGLIGAHFVATIQLVVYAGAIMVLFVFSIMLLNLKKLNDAPLFTTPRFIVGTICGLAIIFTGGLYLMQWTPQQFGSWDNAAMLAAGGNTRVLAHSLFTQHSIAFEAVSVALIVALVGAVTLAKRKFQ